MAEPSVEFLRAVYDDWNHGDFDHLLTRVRLDFRFETAQLFSDTDAVYEGREGFRKFIETFTEAWERLRIEVAQIDLIETKPRGDLLLSLLTFQGQGRGSGVEVSVPYAHLALVRDGVLVSLRGFDSWDKARHAAHQ